MSIKRDYQQQQAKPSQSVCRQWLANHQTFSATFTTEPPRNDNHSHDITSKGNIRTMRDTRTRPTHAAAMLMGMLLVAISMLLATTAVNGAVTALKRGVIHGDNAQTVFTSYDNENENQEHTRRHRPIVFWHGLGDVCCGVSSLQYVADVIVETLRTADKGEEVTTSTVGAADNDGKPLVNSTATSGGGVLHDSDTVYIFSVATGDGEAADRRSGFFGYMWDEVAEACAVLSQDAVLAAASRDGTGINFVGFSQGGLFVRALLATCPDIVPHNVITMGSPNAGISEVPNCNGALEGSLHCRAARGLLLRGAYLPLVQNRVVPAQYFRKHSDIDAYHTGNRFLPYLDGEVESAETTIYRNAMLRIHRLAMVMFANDTLLTPRETSHFAVYNADRDVVPLQKREWFANDTMGLRTLQEHGALDFLTVPGDHMQIDEEWLLKVLVPVYLLD